MPQPLQLAISITSYGFSGLVIALFVVKLRQLTKVIRGGQPDPTRNSKRGQRFHWMLREVFSHTKMLRFSGSGVAHWFVMIGFGALLGTLVTAYGQVIDPAFALPIIGHFTPYEWMTEFIAWATGIGIVTLISIRQLTRIIRPGRQSRFFGSNSWRAYYVEATILVVVFCVIALRSLEGAREGVSRSNVHYPLTFPIADLFTRLSASSIDNLIILIAAIKIAVSMTWFIIIALNLNMGVAWHRFLAFFNIYFQRNPDARPSLGELPEMLSHGKAIDFEDPKEDDVFGIGSSADITWKALLDMATCTECGRCQSQCPAWHTEKPLSPKLLMMAMRDHAIINTSSAPIVGDTAENAISQEVLWSCTTCGACVQECPVDIEHVDHIVNMRRFQVLIESEFPTELGNTFRNLEKTGNPWGANRNDRNAWIAECDFPIRVIEGEIPEDIEYLFWVGCAGAFEERAKRTTKAVAELLSIAGVSFGVLGSRETCTGDPARRAGNEFLYQILSRENIETLNLTFGSRGTKKVVVTCPHCFTTLGRDYRQNGFELEMVHHTQLLNRLVREKVLRPIAKAQTNKITYHDPCYLGRHNQIYEAPREILESTGAEFIELPRNKERSFCCGAGGGRMWMEEKIGTRINLNRVDEALAVQSDSIAVACPFCRIMVSDGVAGRQAEGGREVEVIDVAQALLRSITSD